MLGLNVKVEFPPTTTLWTTGVGFGVGAVEDMTVEVLVVDGVVNNALVDGGMDLMARALNLVKVLPVFGGFTAKTMPFWQ